MTVSKILQEQAGIQYKGVVDKSEVPPNDSLSNVLVTGKFNRGRLDKPFKVSLSNYRAKLGYDPQNPDFIAVEDALKSGAPFIWVQRIEDAKAASSNITCDGAETAVAISNSFINEDGQYNHTESKFAVEVNGVWYNKDFSKDLSDVLTSTGLPLVASASSNGDIIISVINVGEFRIRLSPSPEQKQYSDRILSSDSYYYNPTIFKDGDDFLFCLSGDSTYG